MRFSEKVNKKCRDILERMNLIPTHTAKNGEVFPTEKGPFGNPDFKKARIHEGDLGVSNQLSILQSTEIGIPFASFLFQDRLRAGIFFRSLRTQIFLPFKIERNANESFKGGLMAVEMTQAFQQRNTCATKRIRNTAENLADAVSRWKIEPTAHRKRNVFNSIGAMERLIKVIKNEVAGTTNLPIEGCYKCSAHAEGKSTEAEREKNLFRVAGEWLCRECHIRMYGKDLYWEKKERMNHWTRW